MSVAGALTPPSLGSARRSLVPMAARIGVTVLMGASVAAVVGVVPAKLAPLLLLAAPVCVVLYALVVRFGPKWCLAALLVATEFGFYGSGSSVSTGRVHLRATDIPYVALAIWVLVVRLRRGKLRTDIGQLPLAILLGVFGLSLLPLLVTDHSSFFSPFVSWARFVETMSLVWLLPYAFSTVSDRRFLMRTVLVACSTSLGWALLSAARAGHLGARLRGQNGPDTEGLIAAVLVVTVLFTDQPQKRWLRFSLAGLGFVCVGMSRSVGSIAALGLVLGFTTWRRHRPRRDAGLLRPARLILLVSGVVIAALVLRPGNLPGSKGFASSSSTATRVMYALDGLDQFSRHPVLGVGFSRSALPTNIGDPSIVANLRRWFPRSPTSFFPYQSHCISQTVLSGTLKSYGGANSGCDLGSVHNAYIQVPAESGIVGLMTLLLVAYAMRKRIRIARIAAAEDLEIAATLRWAVLVLALVLVWWNDNPLYGAQPETVFAALALGTLAVPWTRFASIRRSAPALSGSHH